jgi:hypothetical protein
MICTTAPTASSANSPYTTHMGTGGSDLRSPGFCARRGGGHERRMAQNCCAPTPPLLTRARVRAGLTAHGAACVQAPPPPLALAPHGCSCRCTHLQGRRLAGQLGERVVALAEDGGRGGGLGLATVGDAAALGAAAAVGRHGVPAGLGSHDGGGTGRRCDDDSRALRKTWRRSGMRAGRPKVPPGGAAPPSHNGRVTGPLGAHGAPQRTIFRWSRRGGVRSRSGLTIVVRARTAGRAEVNARSAATLRTRTV